MSRLPRPFSSAALFVLLCGATGCFTRAVLEDDFSVVWNDDQGRVVQRHRRADETFLQRLPLLPFALALDVVTAPVQLAVHVIGNT